MTEEILRIENLHVKVEDTPILHGLTLTVNRGEKHVIMGRNGAGKSTLASVIMGHPAYEITQGKVFFMGQPLEELDVFERARAGIFLSFQYPAVIPGVQVGTFLKKSVQSVRQEQLKARAFRKELNEAMNTLDMQKSNQIAPDAGCLIITHYQRLLDHVKPDFVHVMINGQLVMSGGPELALKLEDQGYDWLDTPEVEA